MPASIAMWYGRIRWAFRLTRTFDTSIPRSESMSSSPIRVAGLTTTPGPMTQPMWG